MILGYQKSRGTDKRKAKRGSINTNLYPSFDYQEVETECNLLIFLKDFRGS